MVGTSRVGTVPHVCQESIDWLALACRHGGGGRSGQTEAWRRGRPTAVIGQSYVRAEY
jgi:hypothetical protein